jgi:hypothetical protein
MDAHEHRWTKVITRDGPKFVCTVKGCMAEKPA